MKRRNLLVTSIVICLIILLAALTITSCTEPVAKGGVLRIALGRDAESLGDPTFIRQANTNIIASPCVESLLRLDAAEVPQPWLAESWTIDATAKTITLKLRKGIKFHDGTDFNAEAVKYNLDRYRLSPEVFLKLVSSVDVVDDYTVRLNMSKFDNTILTVLAVQGGRMVSPTAMKAQGAEYASTHPVGTGPFKFVSWVRETSIKYEKFAGYWQPGKPALDGLEFKIIVDPMTSLASFKAGEVDVLLDVSPKDAKGLTVSGQKLNFSSVTQGINWMTGDSVHTNSPFSNLKVRQAASYAIDTKAICNSIGFGYWISNNQPAKHNGWEYNSNIKGYPYNPDKAKQLLAEAGYPNGFKTKLLVINNPRDTVDAFTAAQDYLKKVGIDATLELGDRGKMDVANKGGWDNGFLAMGMGMATPDAAARLNLHFASNSPFWKSMIRPEGTDKLIQSMLTAADFKTKQSLAHQLIKSIVDDNCLVNIVYESPGIAAKNAAVNNEGLYETIQAQWTPESASLSKK